MPKEWIVPDADIGVDGAYFGYQELVRCKDCRWHKDVEPGMVYCPATVGGWVENDWFCKGGNRKDGDMDG